MHTPSFQKFNDFDNFNWVYVIRLHLMHNLHGGGKERRKKQKFRNYEIDSKKKEKNVLRLRALLDEMDDDMEWKIMDDGAAAAAFHYQ